jgi:hypothetical protein
MAWMRRIAALALAVFAGAALAQAPELQPSAAQQCLTHAAGKDAQPDYPIAEFNHNVGGRVQVELTFSRPDRAPGVTILLQHASQRLVDAVLEHLRGLRVPCLDPQSAPVRLSQDFFFAADHRQVHWSDPMDSDMSRRAALLGCVTHATGSIRPRYPVWAERRQLQGRVLARARFVNATDAPEVEVFSRPYASGLADEVKDWFKSVRLPCHVGDPITAVWTFVYLIEGERYGFKELTLRSFVGGAKGIRSQTLAFDTTTMGCPFDLQLHYRQPAMANAVGEVGPPNPARRPLLEWMAATEFDLGAKSLDSIFGDTAKLTVPCLRINLKPQEKS